MKRIRTVPIRVMPAYKDSDRDGVPNFIDCQPYNPFKQGRFERTAGVLTGGRYGQTREEYEQEKTEKAVDKAISAHEVQKEKEKQQFIDEVRGEVEPTGRKAPVDMPTKRQVKKMYDETYKKLKPKLKEQELLKKHDIQAKSA